MSHSQDNLLFESIQIREGVPQRLAMHEERMNSSRSHLLGLHEPISLPALNVPYDLRTGVVKCRVSYGESVGDITFAAYNIRLHTSVRVVEIPDLDYSHKFTDRGKLAELEEQHPQVLSIISRHGFLTDATFANIALFDGYDWVTPSTYLLNGTMRRWLLERGTICEREIRISDLTNYRSIKLVNAMLEWDESPIILLY